MAENESEIPKRSGKGHSTSLLVILIIVAALVVISIPVGVAVLTYWWASQYTGELDVEPETGLEIHEQLIIESVTLQGDGSVEACIRNATSVDAWIDVAYKNGNIIASKVNQKISRKDTTCFTLPGTFTDGDEVTLITVEGTWIRFKVKG